MRQKESRLFHMSGNAEQKALAALARLYEEACKISFRT